MPIPAHHVSRRSSDAAIRYTATLFVDSYLDALRSLRPRGMADLPCFGYGHGGIAYTLLKAGMLRRDRSLVLAARRWTEVGIRRARRFHMRGWPKASFSLGMTGLHAIHALASHAEGNETACRRELRRFVESARRGRGSVELFQGAAGRLAGAALVLRSIPDPGVRALGDQLAARVVPALEARAGRLEPDGLAHGWAGVVLGALAWQAVSRSLPEDALRRAVRASYPYEVSPQLQRWRLDWAHGHAGRALLFARAYRELGDREFLVWAREAAEQVRAEPLRGGGLLDGPPGIAYALLAVAAADPAGPWREAASTITARILAHVEIPERHPYGVWAGLGGVCCLALDLIHGTDAWFPGIEA